MSKRDSRPYYQRKATHKGKKCNRGQPIFYEEVKQRITLTLTPIALEELKTLAIRRACSRSEVIEQWLRQSNSAND
ncbi:hypothetical protein H6F86_16690 [Phormidium sp. FACHB-592]|uniref:Ribbon-helix-helix domain-containing protein n=1 Tax=Stenomitos frigidus AS-A4 TaxID=2933935 RepID=A0ABV0KPB2_9CYAN|nr:CopG family transcriptional regulator [Phormidium sp. FACHB-592]MBD2075503.1 hypothetical protein [Phormidium sp. FACHB-592]